MRRVVLSRGATLARRRSSPWKSSGCSPVAFSMSVRCVCVTGKSVWQPASFAHAACSTVLTCLWRECCGPPPLPHPPPPRPAGSTSKLTPHAHAWEGCKRRMGVMERSCGERVVRVVVLIVATSMRQEGVGWGDGWGGGCPGCIGVLRGFDTLGSLALWVA